MEALKLDRTKLITKSAYAKKIGVSPAAIDKQCKKGKLTVIKIEGTELIYLT
tara:strand:+ start:906 stop:1061 length:156 start_codon:yes stop_codon:yes gene_type:complete